MCFSINETYVYVVTALASSVSLYLSQTILKFLKKFYHYWNNFLQIYKCKPNSALTYTITNTHVIKQEILVRIERDRQTDGRTKKIEFIKKCSKGFKWQIWIVFVYICMSMHIHTFIHIHIYAFTSICILTTRSMNKQFDKMWYEYLNEWMNECLNFCINTLGNSNNIISNIW